jgi:hypothetical protein
VHALGQLVGQTNTLVLATISTVRYGCNVKGINQSVHFTYGDLWLILTDILTVSTKGRVGGLPLWESSFSESRNPLVSTKY